MSFVLDASATLAAFLPDERNGFAVELVRRLVSERATVPALWAAEIANSLHMARRRGRIDDAFVAVALEDLLGLPLDVDRDDPRKRMSTHLRMAKQLGLTNRVRRDISGARESIAASAGDVRQALERRR